MRSRHGPKLTHAEPAPASNAAAMSWHAIYYSSSPWCTGTALPPCALEARSASMTARSRTPSMSEVLYAVSASASPRTCSGRLTEWSPP